MKIKLIIILLILYQHSFCQNNFESQKKVAFKIINHINDIRKNPNKYKVMYKTFNIEDYIVSNTQLQYDEKLSYECYKYAKYLATTNTFEHCHCNVNESLGMGYPPVLAPLMLLNEYGAELGEIGHRKHLLGCDMFNYDTKIGIGYYYYNNKFYTVIRTK